MGRGLNKNIVATTMIDSWMRSELKSMSLTSKKRRGVSIIVMNALAGKGDYITYLRRNAKVENKRYNKWQISNNLFCWCVDFLTENGWIESVVGDASPNDEQQTPSMFKASTKLSTLFPATETDEASKIYRNTLETIILRDNEKNDCGYRDNGERTQMRTVVKKINLVNEGHVFMHNGEKLNNSCLVRIFNGTFEQGGRFYRADSQLIKQRDSQGIELPIHMTRVGMTIDGEPVVEVDYSCLHPMIVCAKYGILEERYLARDFYSTFLKENSVGVDRQLVKVGVNIMFNSTSKSSAEKAIQMEINKATAKNGGERVYTWSSGKELVRRIYEMMPDMEDFFCTPNSFGKTLQHIDSCIAERVIERFITVGEPIVPVHDSFIVKHHQEVFLCRAMEEAFRHTTGNKNIQLTVKIKRFDGDEQVELF